jgi:cytosine/adenosine deaminase-related metal-dependent hydrolase
MSLKKISRKMITAAWVAPMTGPLVREGAIVFSDGRVEAVGEAGEVRKKYPDAEIVELGHAVILPGLVNAHTHLELSNIRRGEKPKHLATWITQTILPQAPRTPGAGKENALGEVETAVLAGVEQCLKFGVTTVGDITKQCLLTRAALRDGPLRVVSFGEIQAMAKRRGLLEERFANAADTSSESQWLRAGISPHAPYTVEAEGYRRCLAFAKSQNRPLATHLAETAEETEFLAAHTGPFRNLWETGVNAWSDDVPKFSGGPIRFARELGLLDYPSLLAHVNYCDDGEMDILATGKASVVFCPRTHEFFGHPPHRWREMLKRGINVAVGTDSCASSPDLNIVDDLRLLHRMFPEEPAMLLWEMATVRAAQAIGMSYGPSSPSPGTPGEGWGEGRGKNPVGIIRAGAAADFTVFQCLSGDPLLEILQSDLLPTSVWIEGKRIYFD